MTRYLELLNLLLAFGPKLPLILASIEKIVMTVMEEVGNIRDILGIAESFASHELSAEEAAAEQAVIAQAMGGAETFGGPLQRILDFIRANPELIALLVSLFAKK